VRDWRKDGRAHRIIYITFLSNETRNNLVEHEPWENCSMLSCFIVLVMRSGDHEGCCWGLQLYLRMGLLRQCGPCLVDGQSVAGSRTAHYRILKSLFALLPVSFALTCTVTLDSTISFVRNSWSDPLTPYPWSLWILWNHGYQIELSRLAGGGGGGCFVGKVDKSIFRFCFLVHKCEFRKSSKWN
jgi:hypothetical protein